MPAIITHDTFGREIYDSMRVTIGGSTREADAFLLGNQGPDPLFYSVVNPRLKAVHNLGYEMHEHNPNELLLAFKESLLELDEKEFPIGRAYTFGLLCHYALDSTVHPLVFMYEKTLCGAGEPDLSEENHNEVHAVIESEIDEMVLFVKREETVASFDPSKVILQADDTVLGIISKMYVYVAKHAFNRKIPTYAYRDSVKCFRKVQRFFHSSTGKKRDRIAKVEEKFRRYSFYRAMSHRPIELEDSTFSNSEHAEWTNPFTGAHSTASFWDLYEIALALASNAIYEFEQGSFDSETAAQITNSLDFSGKPTPELL